MREDTSFLFDKYADKYDLWYERNYFAWASELELVKRFRCEKALEIGVGSGRFGSYINILAGIDPSIRLLEKARDIEKILGYGEHLPFREGSFECSFLIVTLCFVKDPYEVVREALRVSDRVITCIVPKESFLGRRYVEEAEKGHIFYSKARFYTTQEVINMFSKYDAEPNRIMGTITDHPENLKNIDVISNISSLEETSRYGFICIEFLKKKI